MNYRHSFHAGNFADVHKHAVLARILEYLRQKPGGFRVIDSHAGAGRYDLSAAEPSRSGEWRDGIARIWEKLAETDVRVRELLAPYIEAVAACNTDGDLSTYPGSPLIAQKMLRGQDRLVACEIEPRSAAGLAGVLRGDRRAKAIAIDGWTAIPAYVPPKERRGLVFIDPSFEDAGDFTHLSEALSAAHRKWPAGIYVLWYPVKTREGPDALARRLGRLGIANILRCEMMLRPPHADSGLAGSGLILVNPPYTLEQELQILLPALIRMLAPQAEQASRRLDWLTPNL
jgi:23S rRNA (adenine2030-N6)-methyltransferase